MMENFVKWFCTALVILSCPYFYSNSSINECEAKPEDVNDLNTMLSIFTHNEPEMLEIFTTSENFENYFTNWNLTLIEQDSTIQSMPRLFVPTNVQINADCRFNQLLQNLSRDTLQGDYFKTLFDNLTSNNLINNSTSHSNTYVRNDEEEEKTSAVESSLNLPETSATINNRSTTNINLNHQSSSTQINTNSVNRFNDLLNMRNDFTERLVRLNDRVQEISLHIFGDASFSNTNFSPTYSSLSIVAGVIALASIFIYVTSSLNNNQIGINNSTDLNNILDSVIDNTITDIPSNFVNNIPGNQFIQSWDRLKNYEREIYSSYVYPLAEKTWAYGSVGIGLTSMFNFLKFSLRRGRFNLLPNFRFHFRPQFFLWNFDHFRFLLFNQRFFEPNYFPLFVRLGPTLFSLWEWFLRFWRFWIV